MVHSGTDGRNSDIGALSDFSDDDEETGVEQLSGCRIPGCQCDGRIPFMDWGSEDMTETQSPTCGSLYGRYGLMAPYQCSGLSGSHLGLFLQLLHGL